MSFGTPDFKIPDNLEYEPLKPERIWISTADYRPCIVDGMKATFHRWADKSWIVPPSPMVGGHQGGVVHGTYAIIELKDGTVREVEPEKVCFLTDAELYQRHCLGKFEVGGNG